MSASPSTSTSSATAAVEMVTADTSAAQQPPMGAIVQRGYGGPEVLESVTIGRPAIGDHEVLVRVTAAGVDRGVWHAVTGLPYVTRAVFGLRRPKNPVPGSDMAGVIETVGPAVTRFAEGDVVFGTGYGTFAEYVRADEHTLAAVPRRLAVADAGALAVSGSTALQAVEDHGHVQPGHRVLVLGASGGVGSFAVQIAVAAGAVVTGVASGDKADIVAGLGAHDVVDYRRDDALDGRARYDVVIDAGGNRSLRDLRRALTPTGTVVIVGGEGGGRWLGGSDRQLRAKLVSTVSRQHLTTFVASEDAAHLERLADLVDNGHVTPVIDRRYALADASEALRHLEAGRARGKIVLDVGT